MPPPDGRRIPAIVAMGGGGFTAGTDDPALDELVLELAHTPRPRICLLPTADGDSDHQIRRFHETYGDRLCEPSHISLFRLGRTPRPVYLEAVRTGEIPPGYAVDDGAALVFRHRSLHEVVSARTGARAYEVDRIGARPLPARTLAAPSEPGRPPAAAVAELRRLRLSHLAD